MIDKLKPCPFCGGEAIEARESRDERFGYCGINVIRCKDCPAMVRVSDPQGPNGWAERSGMPEAITAWNTRAAAALEPSGDVVEAAWRNGYQCARDCLSDDAAFDLTVDVENDAWGDSVTRQALGARHAE